MLGWDNAKRMIAAWTEPGRRDPSSPPAILNGGFDERGCMCAAEGAIGLVGECGPIAAWSVSDPARVGVQPLPSGLRNMGPAKVEAGTHFAFLRGAGSGIRQAVDGLTVGARYILRFRFAARDYADATSPSGQQITAIVRTQSGETVGATTCAGRRSAFAPASVAFVAPEPCIVVEFRNTSAPGETTVCVTGVELRERG